MNELFDIEEELNKLPHSPGVYIMHSDKEEILYVGKAVDLHNRVRQYFRKGHGHNNSPKIAKMVSQIAYFEYIVTSSDMEALVLECNLIKEYRPKYNTLMTDDKGYPYIKVTTNERFPRVISSHRMSRDGAQYFGPYTDRKAVGDNILLLKKLFLIRNCNKDLDHKKLDMRPCLYHQIGQCTAPCAGLISESEYRESIDKAVSFLNGNVKDITRELTVQMKTLAADMEFEKAAEIRDLITSIEKIHEKQRVKSTDSNDQDIIAMARNESDAVISIFFMRDSTLLGRENHHMSVSIEEEDSDIISAFVKQYYVGTPYIPKEVITDIPLTDHELVTRYLSDRKQSSVTITHPQKGRKKELLSMAKDNASLILAQDIERIKRQEKRTLGACQDIADIIGREKVSRIEAFDISNISGYHSVASMVVFEDGRPKKNAYRKFRLRTIEGPDDYASMKEVLSRRYTNEQLGCFPDVIMMDGGKGQVHIAEMVIDSLGLDIPVCGMVKDDKHRTRGLYYKDQETAFPKGSEAIQMITALQDETHRFAITYHKLLRSKEQTTSILDDIDGIGPRRRKALLLHFKDIEAIKNASMDELSEAPGITRAAAEAVYDFFH